MAPTHDDFRQVPSDATEQQYQAEGPGFHPFYRLISLPFEWIYTMSRVRYWIIPFNLIFGIAALIVLTISSGQFLAAPANQVLHPISVGQVIAGTSYRYVSVDGNLVQDFRYTESKNGSVTGKYTAVLQGKDLLFVKGDTLPDQGPYVGMLKAFPSDLQSMVAEDARNPKLAPGIRFSTAEYLDSTARPETQAYYLRLMTGSAVAALLLLIPMLFGYALFRPSRGERLDAPATGPAWPIRVSAHGRFRSEGNGKQHTEQFMPATLIRTGNPEQPLEVRYVVRGRKGTETGHVLPIPAGSEVEWGYLYGGGKPKPTLSFRFGRQKARISVPTEAHARWIAEAFAVGSL
ncbi:MAG: hypothetical protein ACM3XM_10165 [Mycobacterium leprae]